MTYTLPLLNNGPFKNLFCTPYMSIFTPLSTKKRCTQIIPCGNPLLIKLTNQSMTCDDIQALKIQPTKCCHIIIFFLPHKLKTLTPFLYTYNMCHQPQPRRSKSCLKHQHCCLYCRVTSLYHE